MGPMYDTALGIPFINTVEFHGIASPEAIQPGGKIDIMRYQHRHAVIQLKNKALVTRSVIVVRQHLAHDASGLYCHGMLTLAECLRYAPVCRSMGCCRYRLNFGSGNSMRPRLREMEKGIGDCNGSHQP